MSSANQEENVFDSVPVGNGCPCCKNRHVMAQQPRGAGMFSVLKPSHPLLKGRRRHLGERRFHLPPPKFCAVQRFERATSWLALKKYPNSNNSFNNRRIRIICIIISKWLDRVGWLSRCLDAWHVGGGRGSHFGILITAPQSSCYYY